VDTAGRLHTKKNLMDELNKIQRIIDKELCDCSQEILIVLDGTTGQNALIQAKEFSEVTKITGIVLTKLDGTAKGGVVIGISDQLKVPVKYIGLGEQMEDLQLFNRREFVDSLFNEKESD
jgi:fused signal recognition particle receptor